MFAFSFSFSDIYSGYMHKQHQVSCVLEIWFKIIYNIVINIIIRGFTKYSRADYLKWKSENRIMPDGVNAKVVILKILWNIISFKHTVFTNDLFSYICVCNTL